MYFCCGSVALSCPQGSCKPSAALGERAAVVRDAHGHMQRDGCPVVPELTPPGPREIEELKIRVFPSLPHISSHVINKNWEFLPPREEAAVERQR